MENTYTGNKMLLWLVLAFVVGAVLMGLLDSVAKRPLFSRAASCITAGRFLYCPFDDVKGGARGETRQAPQGQSGGGATSGGAK